MVKRKATSSGKQPSKRTQLSPPPQTAIDTEAILDQAEPYRLATAKLPLDALTTVWAVGRNRPIDPKHVQALSRIFSEQLLQREAKENRLRLACSKATVERMINHLAQQQDTLPANPASEVLNFDDWLAVNSVPAEIIAGQHRVKALQMFLQQLADASKDRAIHRENSWWICDIYDIDQLPLQLSMQLRANRPSVILPDNHAQIWTALTTLAHQDPTLFQGTRGSIQDEMIQALGLSARVQFPIRRLITLWKNEKWNSIITRWCHTSLGQGLFNVSLWEEMARCRIDDFWVIPFDQVLTVTTQLVGSRPDGIQLADWNLLVQLPLARSATDVRQLFYPDAPIDISPTTPSRAKFLVQLDPTSYFNAYQTLLTNPGLIFAPIQKILLAARTQGKVASTLLRHVSSWINPHLDGQEKTRLQLWEGLHPDPLIAYDLQTSIFDLLRGRIEEFSSGSNDTLLTQLPSPLNKSYLNRFQISIWRDLLLKVRQTAGPCFKGVLSRFNTEDPINRSPPPDTFFLKDIFLTLSQLPFIACNPLLNQAPSLRQLMNELSLPIIQWALTHSRMIPQDADAGNVSRWPSEVQELVAAQRHELNLILPEEPNASPSQRPSLSIPSDQEAHRSEDTPNTIESIREERVVESPEETPIAAHTQKPTREEVSSSLLRKKQLDHERAERNKDGQQTSPNPSASGFQLSDLLPDLAQAKKKHHQRQGSRTPAQPTLLLTSQDAESLNPREVQKPAPSQGSSTRSAPSKKKVPAWMQAPAAQASHPRN